MCLNYGRGPCISAHKTANPINTDQNHISNRFQPTKDADHKEIRCYPANFNKFLEVRPALPSILPKTKNT